MVTNLDEFDDALVTEGVGPRKRESAAEHGDVEITCRNCHRTTEGGIGPGEHRVLNLLPANLCSPFED
jgi:hypothetical protein